MLWNVAQLLKEGVGGSRQVEIRGELCDLDENNPGATLIAGHARLVRTPRGILVTGEAHLKMARACRRCLELTTQEISLEIEEEFIPSIDIITGASLFMSDADEAELIIGEHHILDMTEVLRQFAVAVGTEMNLCRLGCKGLCPMCGNNLNLGLCGCDPSSVDSRLVVLAQLLKPSDDQR